jgi:hypothetical protein
MPQRAAQDRTLDASIEAAALYFGNVMHARLKLQLPPHEPVDRPSTVSTTQTEDPL